MNFGDLKSRLRTLIGRDPDALVYEMVTADINQRLRVSHMETDTTLTAAETMALPSDFLAVHSVYYGTNPRCALSPTSKQVINQSYQASGTPREYALIDGNMVVNPVPTQDIELRYYARLSDLSAESDENDILTNYPSIYIFGALSHHASLIRDAESLASWGPQYEAALKIAASSDANNRMSGGPIIPFKGYAP